MEPMYRGIPFSPQTTITDSIGAGDTVIPVADVSAFPDAPNYATIGTDTDGETIKYTAKTSSSLSGCTRGVEGTAKAWGSGSIIARNHTAKDMESLQKNVEEHNEALLGKYSASNPPPYPVASVNGKTGDVSLGAADVKARPETWTPTAAEVGALPAGTKIPGKTSDLTNDSGYITKAVSDLANYYLKSETLTKTEINALVSAIPKFSIQVVSSLPTSGISTTTVYLVAEDGADGNLYTEYIYANGKWEILGSQRVDLTGYATEVFVKDYAQPKGDYALRTEIPAVPVKSVNGKTGAVTLGAADVGAVPMENIVQTTGDIKTNVMSQAAVTRELERLDSEKVDEGFLFDYEMSNNYADMSTLQPGLLHTNGLVYTGDSYDEYSYLEGYIPVTAGEVLSVQYTEKGLRKWSEHNGDGYSFFPRVVAYDSAKSVLTSVSAREVASYVVQAGVHFVRVTFYKALLDVATDIAIVKNATTIIDYQEYGTKEISAIKQKFIPGGGAANSGSLYVSLVETVHVKTGNEFKVYFRNIISRNDVVLWIGYHNSLTTRYYDEYFTVSASAEGEFELPWKVYDQAGNLLESGTLAVSATAKVPTDTTTAMVIGDSTVNDGTMTAKVAELYTADGAVLSLLGTRGGGTHEGRGGWTAEMYCTQASYGDVENPFYNNGFDFFHYMANQNFSGVQVVAIQLGINDIFAFKDYSWAAYDSTPVLEYINEMVTSILAYDPSIKVVINLPTTPNSDGTSFTETYGTTQLYWTYNRNIIRFAKELKDYFKANAQVTVSASNCVLDTKTQIRDGVHPTTDGYNALGQRLYEVLISIVDGQVVVLPLLDISARTRVPHTGGSLSATSQRALDTSKCYDEVFNGTRAQNGVITAYNANGADSLSIQVSTAGGTGMNFPVALEAGKTYTLKYTCDGTGRVYVMQYNFDTSYNTNTMLSSAAGTYTKTVTPDAGYLYGILFVPMAKDTLITFSGIDLTENT